LPAAIARYAVSLLTAFVVVFGLLWVMQYLIATSNRGLTHATDVHFVDFVRVKHQEVVHRREQKPEKPPEPEQPPPTPPPPSAQDVTPEANSVAVQAAPVDTKVDLSASGFSLSPSDGDYLPIVKVQPIYPRRALERGIEGYVIVQFTVTKQGTTKDIKVVESHPPGVFDRAAVQAAAKFKYKPRVVDGQPIQVPGVKNKITFKIEK